MVKTKNRLTVESLHQAIEFMESWTKIRLDLLPGDHVNSDIDDYTNVEIEISKFGGNKVMNEFLKKAKVEFNVTMRDGKVAIYGVGFSFEHKTGGRNGWHYDSRFTMDPKSAFQSFVEVKI